MVKPPPGIRLLPGILLLLAIGYGGKLLEHAIVPHVEYVFWAIVIGFLIANTIGVPEIFRPGVATYELWLKTGIVFLGARFVIGDVLKLGGVSLALVAVELAVAIAFMTALGKTFGVKPKCTSLLAVGSAICGVSAIIATQGAIEADDEDASVAIAAIVVLGAIALVAFPLIGHWLHLSDHAYGLWAGLAVDNTAEATAAGALYSETAGKMAVLAKTTRNAMIGFVVLGYGTYWATKGQATAITSRGRFLWEKFPKFVLGFLLVSVLATVGFFDKPQLTAIGNLSRWAFLLTFAGVGLRTNLREFRALGLRPFAVGAIGEIAIAALTLGLVTAADRAFGL
ncbi:MAG TPA: putative sulfate exporter family transporter [Gemmatimonadaceae bacterium]|nr:putative sulfate exporter family transporter [Gemmatimonadaceae bacterium]